MAGTADAVIVGAGVIGCGVALELARRGLRVVVLDRNPGPGLGSTSASSAIVRFTYSTWAGVALSWEARQRWAVWEDFLGMRDPDGSARFRRCGMVALDDEQTAWTRLTGLFDRAGIAYEHWDPGQLRAFLPGIDVGRYFPPKPVHADAFYDPATATLGAWWTPDAGYVSDPQRAAANLARAAEGRGVVLGYRTTVRGLARRGGTWGVETTAGRFEAPVVVNAAGPWSAAVNRMAGAGEDFRVGVRPLRQEVHRVPAPPGLADRLPFIGDLDLGFYLRPETGGGMLVGGTEPECDPLEWIDDPDQVDPRPTLDRFEAQVLRTARRFPELPVPRRPSGVVGVYDVSSDWIPIYDRTGLDGYYVAIGTSGNQFKNAPVVGELMATLVLAVEAGQDHDRDPVTFRCSFTGADVDLAAFSRRRPPNLDSSGTVMG